MVSTKARLKYVNILSKCERNIRTFCSFNQRWVFFYFCRWYVFTNGTADETCGVLRRPVSVYMLNYIYVKFHKNLVLIILISIGYMTVWAQRWKIKKTKQYWPQPSHNGLPQHPFDKYISKSKLYKYSSNICIYTNIYINGQVKHTFVLPNKYKYSTII